MRHVALSVCIVLVVVVQVSARTWYIKADGSGDAATIQAGIDSSATGDTVLVGAGTYTGLGNRAIDFKGRDVLLVSEFGPQVTVIDCDGAANALRFVSGETAATVIQGITVMDGYSSGNGGAVLCLNSSPTMINCVIASSTSGHYGGGIYCNTSALTLIDCTFSGDSASLDGGGLCCSWSSPTITDCNFINNASGNHAAGLFCTNYSSPAITGCLFLDNSAPFGGGAIGCNYYSSPVIADCTMCGNSGGTGGALEAVDFSEPTLVNSIIVFNTTGCAVSCSMGQVEIQCCDIHGNAGGDWVGCISGQYGADGNFSADPLFCDLPGVDLAVQGCSPCLPGYHPDGYDCGGTIGAFGSGCGCDNAVQPSTWGGIKTQFKE